jgi:hypothetical protein
MALGHDKGSNFFLMGYDQHPSGQRLVQFLAATVAVTCCANNGGPISLVAREHCSLLCVSVLLGMEAGLEAAAAAAAAAAGERAFVGCTQPP